MLIRYSYGTILILVLMGIAVGVLEDIYKGTRLGHFGNPMFWTPLAFMVLVLAGLLWLIPWGKLTKDSFKGLDTIGRIRTIKWSDINRCAYFRLPGLLALRLYDETSRFAVWLYLPAPSRARIEEFILSNAPSSLAANAIAERLTLHSSGTAQKRAAP